LFYIPL